MEALLVEQKAAIEAFNVLYSNFKKKDSSDLSADQLKTIAKDIKQKFLIITNRDDIIRQYRTEDNEEQPYFAQESFKDVQTLNAAFVSEIDELIKKKLLRPRLTGFENYDGQPINGNSVVEMQRNELMNLLENSERIDNS